MCVFSRDETADAQVCVDNGMLVDDESSEWAFGEFPKIDTALANTVQARMKGVKLSTLRYIDVDVEADNAKGWSIVAQRSVWSARSWQVKSMPTSVVI